MNRHIAFTLGVVVGVMAWAGVSSVFAQVSAETAVAQNLRITVTSEAKGKPDAMWIDLASAASAGNAADALQQCKQKSDAAVQAIDALKMPETTVEREMYEFSAAGDSISAYMGGPGAAPSGTRVSQTIRIKVRLGEKATMDDLAARISQLLDAANKTGLGFGRTMRPMASELGGAPVKYVLEDATALRRKTIDDNLKQAAEIKDSFLKAGVKTGRLLAITYGDSAASPVPELASLRALVGGMETRADKSATSSSPEEVAVRSTLTCVYEIDQRPLAAADSAPAPK